MKKSTTLEFLKEHGKCINTIGNHFVFPPIVCVDGCLISVQAGTGYNSHPNTNLDIMQYDEFELRCVDLSIREEETLSIFNCGHDKNLFYNVPIKYIDLLIERHGGIDTDKVQGVIKEHKSND